MMADVLESSRAGRQPPETFRHGHVASAILGAAHRSMGSRQWEPVALDRALLETAD
jgi:hypothetical protein